MLIKRQTLVMLKKKKRKMIELLMLDNLETALEQIVNQKAQEVHKNSKQVEKLKTINWNSTFLTTSLF